MNLLRKYKPKERKIQKYVSRNLFKVENTGSFSEFGQRAFRVRVVLSKTQRWSNKGPFFIN